MQTIDHGPAIMKNRNEKQILFRDIKRVHFHWAILIGPTKLKEYKENYAIL